MSVSPPSHPLDVPRHCDSGDFEEGEENMISWLLFIGIVLVVLGILGLIVRFVGRAAPLLLIIGIILIVIWYFLPGVIPGSGTGAVPTVTPPALSIPTATVATPSLTPTP